jgi:glycosyltransferase involved in cell wall biosynthesis
MADNSSYPRLEKNRIIFSALVALAKVRAESGRYRSAMEWCRTAAGFATTSPIGHLRSSDLEEVIDSIASKLPVLPQKLTKSTHRKVLHVLTESVSIGGLDRLVERWILHDTSTESWVALSRQESMTPRLLRAVESSGGSAVALSAETDPFERASILRMLGHEADVVVCHLLSDDPVACAAFGRGYQGAPVAFADHADHLFWLAPTAANLIVNFRDIGAVLTHQGRGYAESCIHMLPLLIPEGERGSLRAATRHELGLPEDQPMAISVARPVKFRDTALYPRFSTLVETALESVPDMVFCAVGPTHRDEPWAELRERYGDRIIVTGPVQDPQPFLDAADIYIDTFPFSSTTSLLEASASALAVISLDGHRGLRKALGISNFIGAAADRPSDIRAFATRITALAQDAQQIEQSANAARAVHERYSDESRWQSQLQELYAKLDMSTRDDGPIGNAPPPPSSDNLQDYCSAILAIEGRVPLLWRIMTNLSGLDKRDRVMWAMKCGASRALAKVGRQDASEHILLPSPTRYLELIGAHS